MLMMLDSWQHFGDLWDLKGPVNLGRTLKIRAASRFLACCMMGLRALRNQTLATLRILLGLHCIRALFEPS